MRRAPIYIFRPLLNAYQVLQWAARQGFTSALPAADMHVTVAFSRAALDWDAITPDRAALVVHLPATGAQVTQMGSATALRFSSPALATRWRELRAAGASWDHPTYQPHVSLTYRPPPGMSGALAFPGDLHFGPERFQELRPEWACDIREAPLQLLASAAS
jgi:hypothetical protein